MEGSAEGGRERREAAEAKKRGPAIFTEVRAEVVRRECV